MYTSEQIAGMIDHTNLKAFSTQEDLEKLCAEAKTHGFKSVAVNGAAIAWCRKALEGSGVLIDTTVGFPLGQMTIAAKAAEAEDAIREGAQEFDYVINVGRARMHDWSYIEDEMTQLVAVARKAGVCVKVIFENCYLEKEEIAELSRIAARVKPDFIKTSTGFGTGGAAVEDVRIMKENGGPDLKVKAAGGIRTWKAAEAMIQAGASRIGTSAGIAILEELKKSAEADGC
ncbi:MAG: deoxyribose-phosphate aldolase [Eubacteriales bacterium]|nr:deoxyribose-phosphate aldolase [Eubacteriales bacterium]